MTAPTTRITPIPEHPFATQQALVRRREQYRQHRDLFKRQQQKTAGKPLPIQKERGTRDDALQPS